jgi:hypothetical protein
MSSLFLLTLKYANPPILSKLDSYELSKSILSLLSILFGG